jgi:TPP-dependent 2-oxoacid decarboxylase
MPYRWYAEYQLTEKRYVFTTQAKIHELQLTTPGLLLHHTLGNGDFNVYANMSAHVSATTTTLTETAKAASEIDRVLKSSSSPITPS